MEASTGRWRDGKSRNLKFTATWGKGIILNEELSWQPALYTTCRFCSISLNLNPTSWNVCLFLIMHTFLLCSPLTQYIVAHLLNPVSPASIKLMFVYATVKTPQTPHNYILATRERTQGTRCPTVFTGLQHLLHHMFNERHIENLNNWKHNQVYYLHAEGRGFIGRAVLVIGVEVF